MISKGSEVNPLLLLRKTIGLKITTLPKRDPLGDYGILVIFFMFCGDEDLLTPDLTLIGPCIGHW
jgi:hypothetical protein